MTAVYRYSTPEAIVAAGFYKIERCCKGSFIQDLFYNPITDETMRITVSDMHNAANDNWAVYDMPISKGALRAYKAAHPVIEVGSTVRVIKGRKVPIGTIAEVVRFSNYYDCYGHWRATYVHLSNGMKTNKQNCELVLTY